MATKKKAAVPAKKAASKTAGKGGGLAAYRERMAAAKKAGKKVPARKTASKRRPVTVYKAPDDFRPFNLRVDFKTNKDGLVSNLNVTRFKGRPETQGPTINMAEYDPMTATKFALLFGAGTFVNSVARRLPSNTVYSAMMRVTKKAATGGVACRYVSIGLRKPSATKKGKFVSKALDKKDPQYRAIRKSVKTIPGAFTGVLPFPTARELKAMQAEAGDE